jgi:predicted nuclease of predicted toxin-antitoxin system
MGAGQEGQLNLALGRGLEFLIDEDVPASVARLLEGRGHGVTQARESLGRRTPDHVLAKVADTNEMVIVTCNYRDFKKLTQRRPEAGYARFRHLSLITLECEQARALERMTQVISSIEFEFAVCQARSDRRIFVEIRGDRFVIVR